MTPNGKIIQGRFYRAFPDAPEYQGWHKFFSYSQFLQLRNDSTDPLAVGELTHGPGVKPQKGAPRHRGDQQRRRHDAYDKGETPEGADAVELHGTPAAWLGKRELDGSYYAKWWDPETITAEEFYALPECIQAKWIGRLQMVQIAPSDIILEARLEEDLPDVGPNDVDVIFESREESVFRDLGFEPEIILEAIWTDVSVFPEPECDTIYFGDDDDLAWDDDDDGEWYCPEATLCDTIYFGDGDDLAWDDDDDGEWSCPD